MSSSIAISPVSRIEGHLGVKLELDGGRVTNAFVSGEMFRGFETILRGRDPLDAQHITQRICGVCPVEHGVASVEAQEMAYQHLPAETGQIARNLIQGANFIMSHLTHFYVLSALDFVDVAMIARYQGKDSALLGLQTWVKGQLASGTVLPAAPFLPRYTAKYLEDQETNFGLLKHYLEALDIRTLAHAIGAEFAGKLPHAATLVPGGITDKITALKITRFRTGLEKIQRFVDECYLPDLLATARAFPDYFTLGRGGENFLAFGAFTESVETKKKFLPAGVVVAGNPQALDVEAITEDVASSFFSSSSGRHPAQGETVAAPGKNGAYSWVKAPRYRGQVMEVGPLARITVAYRAGDPVVTPALDKLLGLLGREKKDLNSVMGRHVARALECKLLADRCALWLDRLVPSAPTFRDFSVPDTARGFGLTEAARGALGHWLELKGQRISNYQCVVPTTWNCSPRDDRGVPGALEQALVGTPVADPGNPIEPMRVVRSFDPCLACAVH
jgi:Ni,Fe-hydrogenase I large subunit